MLLAMSFVPAYNVIAQLEHLVDTCRDNMDDVINYWKDNYIDRQRRNRRTEPSFAIFIWSIYSRVLNNLPRTMNSVLGWIVFITDHRVPTSSTNKLI